MQKNSCVLSFYIGKNSIRVFWCFHVYFEKFNSCVLNKFILFHPIAAYKKLNSCYLSCFLRLFYNLKVVIPSINCRHKKMVFSTPRDEFWISWRDIWGEGTWDRYLQAPKLHLVISYTYGQRVLTKVAQSAKIDVFKQFWRQK